VLTLFGLILLFSSFYIVPEGYVGTISRLGKFQDQVAMPGFHFKIPFVDRVYLDDVKMQTANYSGKSDEEDKDGIIDKAMLDILDANNVVYHIELTLQFTPIAERMPEIRRIYGANYFDKKINAIVRDAVRDVGGKYVVETVASNREAIDAAIEEALREEFKDLPFILNDASLRQIVLPPDVQAKIKEVQLAKQEEERLKIVVRREEQNKAILETKAAAEKAQKIIQAEAEAAKRNWLRTPKPTGSRRNLPLWLRRTSDWRPLSRRCWSSTSAFRSGMTFCRPMCLGRRPALCSTSQVSNRRTQGFMPCVP